MPMNGKVDVRVKNNTNAPVSYGAIGYTQRRFLPGGEETVQTCHACNCNLVRIRASRCNSHPQQGSIVRVSLDESKNLDDNQGAEFKDGQVF